ncbi:unnamed protein product [Arabis nemorensis]|uniref:Uncharacterized protein n=1 Tax=Arabis nemorensis TaxID=586526 RepID=A0A565BWS1_9BRAS|nr:unnamed protein product [Arabis nemorensis]
MQLELIHLLWRPREILLYIDYHPRYLQERWRGRRFQKRIKRKLVGRKSRDKIV